MKKAVAAEYTQQSRGNEHFANLSLSQVRKKPYCACPPLNSVNAEHGCVKSGAPYHQQVGLQVVLHVLSVYQVGNFFLLRDSLGEPFFLGDLLTYNVFLLKFEHPLPSPLYNVVSGVWVLPTLYRGEGGGVQPNWKTL